MKKNVAQPEFFNLNFEGIIRMKTILKSSNKRTQQDASDLVAELDAIGVDSQVFPSDSGYTVVWATVETMIDSTSRQYLSNLGDWLQDNFDGSFNDVSFLGGDAESVTSEHVFPAWDKYIAPILKNSLPVQICGDNQIYVTVGRVCDFEDKLMFVLAKSSEDAKAKFTQYIKSDQNWDGEREIYIEFIQRLSDFRSFLIT